MVSSFIRIRELTSYFLVQYIIKTWNTKIFLQFWYRQLDVPLIIFSNIKIINQSKKILTCATFKIFYKLKIDAIWKFAVEITTRSWLASWLKMCEKILTFLRAGELEIRRNIRHIKFIYHYDVISVFSKIHSGDRCFRLKLRCLVRSAVVRKFLLKTRLSGLKQEPNYGWPNEAP